MEMSTSPLNTDPATTSVATVVAGTSRPFAVDLPFDVSAAEMKASLEDLPGVGTVTIARSQVLINSTDVGACSWLVTFNSAAGDQPMLYATAGRLTSLASHVSIAVTEVTQGTDSLLVYDGTGIPEVRTTTVKDLLADMTYAFQVTPLNALGEGILSHASVTVVANSGASPLYTSASGSSLATGITYAVDEVQIITTKNCHNASYTLHYGALSTVVSNSMNTAAFTAALQTHLNIGAVQVDQIRSANGSYSLLNWKITFLNSGDVGALSATVTTPANCVVSVEEFISGSHNHFTIEPKSASGAVLRDVTTAAGFSGLDIFLTETYFAGNNSWLRDQGVATYNPPVYEVQKISVATAGSSSVIVSLAACRGRSCRSDLAGPR